MGWFLWARPSWCHAARSMPWGLGWRSWPLCQLQGGLGCPRGGFGWPERALHGEEVASGVQEMVLGGCRVVLGGWEVTVDVREVASSGLGAQEMFFWVAKRGPLPAGPAPVQPHCRAPTGDTGTGVPGGGGTHGEETSPTPCLTPFLLLSRSASPEPPRRDERDGQPHPGRPRPLRLRHPGATLRAPRQAACCGPPGPTQQPGAPRLPPSLVPAAGLRPQKP